MRCFDAIWDDQMERVMGIEPTLFAWEAKVLPLNYTRVCRKEALVYMLSGVKLDTGQARCRPVAAPFISGCHQYTGT